MLSAGRERGKDKKKKQLKKKQRKRAGSSDDGDGESDDCENDEENLPRIFSNARGFALDAAEHRAKVGKVLRAGEKAAAFDSAALKEVLAMGRQLMQNGDELLSTAVQLLTAMTDVAEALAVSPSKSARSSHKRKSLAVYKPEMVRLALELSPFSADWEDEYDNKGFQVLSSLVSEETIVDEDQMTTQLGRIRNGWSKAVQEWLGSKVMMEFPDYKHRSDSAGETNVSVFSFFFFLKFTRMSEAKTFAEKTLLFLNKASAWAKAKQKVGVRELNATARKNVRVLLNFLFRERVVQKVVQEKLENKHGASLPFVAFLVLSLSRAMVGKPLSGKNFNCEKAFRDVLRTLRSDECKVEFEKLLEKYGDGMVADGDNAAEMSRKTEPRKTLATANE